MAHVDSVGASSALNWSIADWEDYALSLTEWDDFDAGLHAWALFGQDELAAGEVNSWPGEQEGDL